MNLHLDREAFKELTAAASTELCIRPDIIEKDYYITLALRELSVRIKGMVFKGGTSLSKCYQIIDRFSEDIDISFPADDGVPGESRKRLMKKSVITSMKALQFPITNLKETRSRRSYNCYRASYPAIYASMPGMKPELIIETYLALLPFPTENRFADNYIYRFLKMTHQESLAEIFDLLPFPVHTQTVERTLIDKVFAICDYYLNDNIDRHSRHLYDIHKIMEHLTLSDSFPDLIREVRMRRALLSICPSAGRDIDMNRILEEIIKKEVYQKDYETITENLLFRSLPYEEAAASLQKIIDGRYFMTSLSNPTFLNPT